MARQYYLDHPDSAFGFGVEYGKVTAKEIHAALKIARVHWPRMARASWRRLVEAGLQLIPHAKKFCPEYMEEARGMAAGAGVAFSELWLLNVEEEVVDRRFGLRSANPPPLAPPYKGGEVDRRDRGRCTTIAVRTPHPRPLPTGQAGSPAGRGEIFYLAHNEDWMPHTTVPFPVVTVRRTSLPSYISVAYPGALPGSVCGVNSAGIAFNENSFELLARRGVPKNFIKRALLDARNIRQVRRILATKPQALSCNFVCVSAIEGVAASYEITRAGVFTLPMRARPLVHTNHILHPRARTRSEKPSAGSFARFKGASALLAAIPAPTPAKLRRILLGPSVFRKGRRANQSATVATILITIPPRNKATLCLTHHLVKGKPHATFSLSRVSHFYT